MLSKQQIRLIRGLSQKKVRSQSGLFVVEGVKGIEEFLNSKFQLNQLYTTSLRFEAPENLTTEISESTLKKLSNLKTPNTALAVFRIPVQKEIINEGLVVALDAVRDPGNLGTIIRLCDWYGITDMICSPDTVDCFNPKVVQATMGSLTRVNVGYLDLEAFLGRTSQNSFGAFMTGENIYNMELPQQGILVLGNEANGISKAVENRIKQKITIPQFGELRATESLNVATATAILLSEFKRRVIET